MIDAMNRKTYQLFDDDGEATATISGVSNTMTVDQLLTTAGSWDVTDDLYDANGNTTETIDGANLTASLQRISTTMFDEFGDAVETIDPMGRVTTNVVDLDGETVESIDPLGNKTYDVYDPDGEVTAMVTGVPASVTASVGTLLITTGAWDVAKDFYDANGNVTETIDGANLTSGQRISTTTFDEFGDAIETQDPLNQKSFSLFDLDGETTATVTGVPSSNSSPVTTLIATTGAWDVLKTFYNADGETTETIDGANLTATLQRVTTMSYDALGDETSAADPLSRASTSYFDQFGDATETVDPAGNKTYDVYDNDGKVTIAVTGVPASVTASIGTLLSTTGAWDVTDTEYDANGGVAETIDGANLTTSLQRISTTTFDEFGDAIETQDPLNRKSFSLFDLDGEATATVTGVPTLNTSPVTTLIGTVGSWDVLETLYNSDGETTETIDGANLTTTLQRVTTMAYDSLGDETSTTDPMGRTTANYFDQFGRRPRPSTRSGTRHSTCTTPTAS